MKKVVIIGGGFTGAYCAKRLQEKFEVTLIDKTEYFEFTPSVLKAIVNPKFSKNIQIRHREYLKKGKFICGEVSEVTEKFVLVNDKKIKFDYLIIASGSRYNSPIKDPLILIPERGSEIREYHDKLEKAKNVAVVGGGLVGVELCAEIINKYPNKIITLVHSHKCLIERNCKRSQNYVEKYIREKGVEIIFGEHASQKTQDTLITDKGNKIKADLVFMCIGIRSNSELMTKNFKDKLDEHGQVKVNEFLQMNEEKKIFVGGDVANIKEEKTAQSAEDHAKIIVRNITRLEYGGKLKKYKAEKKAFVISLGRWNGIFEYRDFILTGIVAAFMKKFIEWKTMRRYR